MWSARCDFRGAVGDYTNALAHDPDNAHALHNRGISHDKSGAFHAAIEDFNEVLRLDGSNADYSSPASIVGARIGGHSITRRALQDAL